MSISLRNTNAAEIPDSQHLIWENQSVTLRASNLDSPSEVRFKFTNATKRTISIENIRKSCGCMNATLDKAEYLPGESGSVVTTIDVSSLPSETYRYISLDEKCDGRKLQSTKLVVHAFIQQEFKISYPQLEWHNQQIGAKNVDIQSESNSVSIDLLETPKYFLIVKEIIDLHHVRLHLTPISGHEEVNELVHFIVLIKGRTIPQFLLCTYTP